MSRTGRICSVAQMTADAKSILGEMERGRVEVMLEEARKDPVAPYSKKKWYPRFLVWELTLACNMNCEHCGSAAGKARDDELSLDEMLRVCDELGELECERVTLLGGEPLIHPHWLQIAKRILKNGFRANVITNGWTLDRESLCDQIKEAELSIVGISVDGMEQSHDRLRAKPGSFARIIKGMKLLRERDIPMAISTVVTNDSLDDIELMHQFLTDNDVKVWQLQIGNPLGRLEKDDPVIIKPERLLELCDFVLSKKGIKEGPRIDIADNVGYFGTYEEQGIRRNRPGTALFWTGCHAGIQAMGLDSNGDVKGCQSMPSTEQFIEGNVRERPLKDIWCDPDAFAYNRKYSLDSLDGDCAECHWGPLCKAGCTSAALGHGGTIGYNPMCVYRVEQQLKK